MAKNKSHRALFDLMAKERGQGPKPVALAAPAPMVRRPAPRPAEPPRREVPVSAPVVVPTRPQVSTRKPADMGVALLDQTFSVTVLHLAIAVVAVVCLCVLSYFLGRSMGGGDNLPSPPKEPTFSGVRQTPPTPGMVAPEPPPPRKTTGPERSGVTPGVRPGGTEKPAPGPAVKPVGPVTAEKPGAVVKPGPAPVVAEKPGPVLPPVVKETPAPPVGPVFRVRIARLGVSQPDTIDKLRAFLAAKNVDTELETRGGFYILYSREQFPDKKKCDVLAGQIKNHLEAFEKQTRIPTAKDAYSIQITKE